MQDLITRIARYFDDLAEEARNLPAFLQELSLRWEDTMSENEYSALESYATKWWNNELGS